MTYPLNHREALEKIATICRQSEMYSRRTQHIHEVAMRSLGLTANQRMAEHMAVFDVAGDEVQRRKFLERAAARQRRLDAMRERPGDAFDESLV